MRSSWCVPIFLTTVKAIVVPPVVTPGPGLPEIARRFAEDNTCGYYSLDGSVTTITCTGGLPCCVRTDLSPALVYCSNSIDLPDTTAFDYTNWPPGGCTAGQKCCPATRPSAGTFNYDGGQTRQFGCDTEQFTLPAFFSDASPTKLSSTPDVPSRSTSPSSRIAPRSSLDSDDTDSGSKTVAIVLIVVGGVCALIGALGFMWLVYRLVHPWLTGSDFSPREGRGSDLSGWQLLVGIAGLVIAVAGIFVSVYFGR